MFKIASEDWEFEQIHRLNYRTFVEEIPQHHGSAAHRLVDRFHEENTYLICLRGRKLLGMLAVRGNRPFSLDAKLEMLDSYLPAGRSICEIRLLAVEKNCRGARVLQGILALLWQYGVKCGFSLAIISGTTRQFRLYRHIGFVPFGPLVGSGDALFQPMYITLEAFEKTAREFLRSCPSGALHDSIVNFLPGPVTVRHEVKRAFEQLPESHRADDFMRAVAATRRLLSDLTHASHVDLMLGSGTLANDAVGAQLGLEQTRGIVLSNGEFGDRLIDHARRIQLDFQAIEFPWGSAIDLAEVRSALASKPAAGWLWCTHCETSTSVLNDLNALKNLCAEFDVRLCVDCISSIGNVPLDLRGVWLASASSGKGLRSYPGIAMVLHHHDIRPQPYRLPRYLDLGLYAQRQGVPFTTSSNLLHALHTAVLDVDWERRFAELAETGLFLRSELSRRGFELVGSGAVTSPAVVTIAIPAEVDSVTAGDSMKKAGYLLSYKSEYLRRKNWMQICLMSDYATHNVQWMIAALDRTRSGVATSRAANINTIAFP